MKGKTYTITLLGLTLMLGSCNVLRPTSQPVSGATGVVETASKSDTSQPRLKPPRADDKGAKKKDKKKDKAKPKLGVNKERQPILNSTVSTAPGAQSINGEEAQIESSAPVSINGEWTIESVRGNKIEGEERPYIVLDEGAKRFYGSNGCNYINGDMIVGAKDTLRLDNMIATMKMCHDAPYEYLINLALHDVMTYRAYQQGSVTKIDLMGADGKVLVVLRRHNMDFLNGAWKVDTLNGTPLNEEDDANLTFNVTDMRVHGCTGCNIVNGDIFIDPDKTHSLQLIRLGTTRKMCRPDSREAEFLLALEEVESAYLLKDGSVEMRNVGGKTLFLLTPLTLRPALQD